MAIQQRQLVPSEIRYGYIELLRLRDYFPDHLQPITIVDADGETFRSKIHSKQNRVDGLTRLYRKHGARIGQTVTIEVRPKESAIAHVFFRGKPMKQGTARLNKLAISKQEADQRALEKSIRAGAGFGSAEQNRKVEKAAIEFITNWYRVRGWHVESVEAEKRGYDLYCRKGTFEEHVEVKGIQGKIPIFIITAGEVRQSKSNKSFVICAVTSALSKAPTLFRYTAREFAKSFDLTPLAYRANLSK